MRDKLPARFGTKYFGSEWNEPATTVNSSVDTGIMFASLEKLQHVSVYH